jgi:hypothetical protein
MNSRIADADRSVVTAPKRGRGTPRSQYKVHSLWLVSTRVIPSAPIDAGPSPDWLIPTLPKVNRTTDAMNPRAAVRRLSRRARSGVTL